MTVDEVIKKLEWVRTHFSGSIEVELYDGITRGYLPCDEVEFVAADEFGSSTAKARLA